MRKVILGIVSIALLFLTTCKADNIPAVSSGTWTFQSVTYNDAQGGTTNWGNSIVSIVATTKRYSDVYMVLSNDSTQSFVSGMYSVGAGPNTNTTKYLNLEVTSANGAPYIPVPNSGTISVYVNNDTIMIASTGAKMINYGLTDTSILTFNITQTY